MKQFNRRIVLNHFQTDDTADNEQTALRSDTSSHFDFNNCEKSVSITQAQYLWVEKDIAAKYNLLA